MKGKIKLLHSLRLFFISLLICLVVSIIIFQIINRYQEFNTRADKMRTDYVEQQKQIIKREVERVVETIQHQKSLSEKKAAAKAKQRVYEAYSLAKHLYQQYQNTKSMREIQTMIKEALRPIRFDQGQGYYFINQFSGIPILIADRPELEGKTLLEHQDTQGRYIIQDMIKIVQQFSEGFYHYTWTKPNTTKKQEFAKITFVKHFEPYDWFIGTGVYVSDIEAQIQTELLEEIGKIRYGKNGYLFVDDWEGVVLMHGTQPQLIGKNIWNFEDSKGVKVVQHLIAASQTEAGDFVYYSWKKPDTGEERAKVSFSMGIPDWQWMIGTGVYIDDIEKEISQLQIELNQNLKREIRNTLFITSAILIIFILFLNLFYRYLRNDFSLFISFFNQAANLDQEIDRKALWFHELAEMANYANQMLRDKRKAQQKLQHHRDHLEVEVTKRTHWLKEKTTQLEQAKEIAEAANQAKSLFLANMSHELRTPLNAILGFAQIMHRSQTLSQEHQENINIINRSGEYLLSLINDVLDMSKIEAGKITLDETNIDLYRLLDEIQDLFYLRAESKQLQLDIERDDNVPRYLCTDGKKLRQVLINLLGNALKFTQEGGIYLYVNDITSPLSKETMKEAILEFQVRDTGAGIAENEMDKLFEAFTQTATGIASQEGTGLGLPISRKFVQLMGGDISVQSKVGEGTTFTFSIHTQIANAADFDSEQSVFRQIIALEPNQPRYRILIVDDKKDNRQLLIKLLNPFGFELQEVTNGQEAIEMAENWQPHFIWMDIRMPVLDGLQATQQIKASYKGKEIVIVALTASSQDEEREQILSAGCDDFLRKPFREFDLFELMHKHIGVRYIYEDIESTTTETTIKLHSEHFAILPPDLLFQLKQASCVGDPQVVDDLIEKIYNYDTGLANALSQLANDFRYDEILTLTQSQESINPQTK